MTYTMTHTILIVDDDSNVLEALRRLLHADGHRIRCAHNADEALRILHVDNVSLAITDQVMPGMSGLEFLKQVQRLHPDVARILLTGYATVEMIIEAINKGGIERSYLKPTAPEEIVAGVRQVLIRRDVIERALCVLDEAQHDTSDSPRNAESFLSNLLRDKDGAIILEEVPYGYRTLVRRLKKISNPAKAVATEIHPLIAKTNKVGIPSRGSTMD